METSPTIGALALDTKKADGSEHLQAVGPMELLQLALSKEAGIDVIERLAALQEKFMAKGAEQSFNASLQAAQSEIKAVRPNKEVKTSAGKLMYAYASYEALDKAIRPIYLKHGFSLSFTVGDAPAGRVRIICRCSHRDGHTQMYQQDLAVDPGKAGLSQTDAELGAGSKAKRRLLRNIFNIVDDGEDETLTNGWLAEKLEYLDNCRTPDELKQQFEAAFNEAKENKAATAMLALVEAKDKKKREWQ